MKLKIHVIANLHKKLYCIILHFVSYEMVFKNTCIKKRKLIFKKLLENCLPKYIASELQLNIRTVQRILNAYREAGQMSPKKNSVCSPELTEKSMSTSQGLAVMCPKMTSKQLKANWSDDHKYTDSQIRSS